MIKQQALFFLSVIILVLTFMQTTNCEIFSVPFNVTVGYPFKWRTESFTDIGYTFLTEKTSGVAVYTDLSDSTDFNSYSIPSNLKGYDLFGVFQIDMQKVITPQGGGASFSFTHFFSFGILNVNPKELCLVGVDKDTKKFLPIDFTTDSTQFTQTITLPIETKVYTMAILGLEREIPASFGVSTLVNYRASLKYEIHKDLNQYLSAFINRPLTYPSHEYIAQLVDNQIALPSNQLIEIASFSFNPMFAQSYQGRMVINDFMFSFDLSKGFVDRNGKQVEIDFESLQCLYIVDEKQGFVQRPRSDVFPTWQKLACSPGIGQNDFYPKYMTIVANRKSAPTPVPSKSSIPQPLVSKSSSEPIHPSFSKGVSGSTNPQNSFHPRNNNQAKTVVNTVLVALMIILSSLLVV
ncbi:predicted protein [Naegleria gruberi]|uniref:Predicted protein n=1 Tax=Naegleria gruberi TaxID=5762 RepID=D2VIL9_NAEGR|nr:uncharacterized protein NAEGRDRAFT_68724 [Naegleria gruberi]EFC43294.1 predicted protein [Naegleria gruberi]|eukprot:XP_002676038.1 predicted protein [Naegleria gruberi strain NEG-M]